MPCYIELGAWGLIYFAKLKLKYIDLIYKYIHFQISLFPQCRQQIETSVYGNARNKESFELSVNGPASSISICNC